jgi:hypothetical protein
LPYQICSEAASRHGLSCSSKLKWVFCEGCPEVGG